MAHAGLDLPGWSIKQEQETDNAGYKSAPGSVSARMRGELTVDDEDAECAAVKLLGRFPESLHGGVHTGECSSESGVERRWGGEMGV